ncbi:hypothetical protein ACFE04_014167 [Oxalis oulophora]
MICSTISESSVNRGEKRSSWCLLWSMMKYQGRYTMELIMFVYDLTSKIMCRVINVELKGEPDIDEVFAQVTLLPRPIVAYVNMADFLFPKNNVVYLNDLHQMVYPDLHQKSEKVYYSTLSLEFHHQNRWIPTISAVMGTKRFPYLARVFDVFRFARCRVSWHIEAPLCSWCGAWKINKNCGSFKKPSYCSPKHQVMHWRSGHKVECKQLLSRSESLHLTLNQSRVTGMVPINRTKKKVAKRGAGNLQSGSSTAGYNTKRQEIDIEYENDVEKLLTNMEFND